jgi:hypothetical protein
MAMSRFHCAPWKATFTDSNEFTAIYEDSRVKEETVYGKVQEYISRDSPIPLGNPVGLVSYVDANLQHDMMIGWSEIRVFFCIQNLIDWVSKWQADI